MDAKNLRVERTMDLLEVCLMGGIQDTALYGAIRKELAARHVNVERTREQVMAVLAHVASAAPYIPDEEDESLYCAGLEPGSWCEDDEEDRP